MQSVSRILVAIDLHGDNAPVLARAVHLASVLGASLELFAPVYNGYVNRAHFPETPVLEHARGRLVSSGLARLQALAQRVSGTVKVECEAAWDHPAEEALIRRALVTRADLVVAGIQPHPDHRLPLMACAEWQLIRHCPAPLLLCLPSPWKAQPVIVAAVDPVGGHGRGGGLDVRLLEWAGRLSRACGGRFRAFHAYEAIVYGPGPGVRIELPVDEAEASLERSHTRAVEEALGAAGVEACEMDIEEGDARDRLPEYCVEVGADLVVMGAVARNPLGRIFIGSTAERVLHRLPCDLLVIKPEGFRTAVAGERYGREAEAGPMIGVPGI